MKIIVETQLYATTDSEVELPEGVTWNDIKLWYVKWDTLFITTYEGVSYEIPLYSHTWDIVDWKRPEHTTIYEKDWIILAED